MDGFARSARVFSINEEFRWNGIPTIEVSEGGTLLVAWYSGGLGSHMRRTRYSSPDHLTTGGAGSTQL